MEKCSYCIQRINEARIEVKLKNLPGPPAIPDGFFQTACQQACPTDAIVFGDLLDTTSDDGHGHKGSRVKRLRDHARSYLLLGFLDTRPRTTHMVAVRNPNPLIRPPVTDILHEHGGEHDGGESHKEGHALFSPAPAAGGRDEGHRMSLTVLSGVPA
jgi:molybdopterin-containing oxidoreductase family iron-sulfur binding subunit